MPKDPECSSFSECFDNYVEETKEEGKIDLEVVSSQIMPYPIAKLLADLHCKYNIKLRLHYSNAEYVTFKYKTN